MGKSFNTSGVCIKERHYMADTTRMLRSIRSMVEHGDYFVMNHARQFGKTTILRSLAQSLRQKGYRNILKYRVAFWRKECMVKLEK